MKIFHKNIISIFISFIIGHFVYNSTLRQKRKTTESFFRQEKKLSDKIVT